MVEIMNLSFLAEVLHLLFHFQPAAVQFAGQRFQWDRFPRFRIS